MTKIDFIPKDMNIPVMRRELTHSNTAWLLRNILVNNKEHPKIDEVVAQLKTLRS